MEMKTYNLSKRFVQIETGEDISVKIDSGVTEVLEAGKYVLDLINMDAKVLQYTGEPKITERAYFINKKAESVKDVQEIQVIKNEVPNVNVSVSGGAGAYREGIATGLEIFKEWYHHYYTHNLYIKHNDIYHRVYGSKDEGNYYFFLEYFDLMNGVIYIDPNDPSINTVKQVMSTELEYKLQEKIKENYLTINMDYFNSGVFKDYALRTKNKPDVVRCNYKMIFNDQTVIVTSVTVPVVATDNWKMYTDHGNIMFNPVDKKVTSNGQTYEVQGLSLIM